MVMISINIDVMSPPIDVFNGNWYGGWVYILMYLMATDKVCCEWKGPLFKEVNKPMVVYAGSEINLSSQPEMYGW